MKKCPSTGEEKAFWRARLRLVRKEIDAQARVQFGRELAAMLPILIAGTFLPAAAFVYESMGSEAPTDLLIADLLSRGWDVFVPSACGRDAVHDSFVRLSADGSRVLLGCSAELDALIAATRLVLLPGLCWDAWGTRLGQGGGYYDRVLTKFPAHAVRCGAAYECQLLPDGGRLPRDSWDVPTDKVLCPGGIWLPDADRGIWTIIKK